MAIAPQNIMSKLRLMPDAELASYARTHQKDPYIFPLAFQESQDRQRMRSTQQAQAAGAQQPKVVDQDLQQMTQAATPQQVAQLPEQMGIGQLPTPNMETLHKAAGGIIAFNEGGDVPRFFDGGVPRRPAARFPGDVSSMQWDKMYGATFNPDGTPKLVPAYIRDETGAYVKNPERAAQDMAMFDKATENYMADRDAKAAASGIGALTDKTGAGNQDTSADRGLTAAAPTAGAGLPSVQSYIKQFTDAVGKNDVSKEDRLKEIEGINKPVLEKLQATIDENKDKLKTEKEQNFYMALIQGGLAAAGESGPNALQNLAKGFEKGAASYGEGLKDLRKAAKENAKMEVAKAEFEATGKKDALKSYYDHQDKQQALVAQGYSSMLGHEISGRYGLAAAGAGANAQRSLMEAIGNAPEGSALRKGFEMTKQEGRIPAMYDAYVKAATDPMKGDDFRRLYPDFQTYLAGMGGAGAGKFINVPDGTKPNATVRAP